MSARYFFCARRRLEDVVWRMLPAGEAREDNRSPNEHPLCEGRWDGSQMDWSYYVTWTFEEPKAPKVAAGIIKDHLETLDPQKAFWKIEEGDIGGREHAHGLLEFEKEGTQKEVEIKRIWSRAFGGVDIQEYESGKGAAHYVGQYLKGKVSEWGLYPSGSPTPGGGQWGGG